MSAAILLFIDINNFKKNENARNIKTKKVKAAAPSNYKAVQISKLYKYQDGYRNTTPGCTINTVGGCDVMANFINLFLKYC